MWPRYWVAFDGKWQRRFRNAEEAKDWAARQAIPDGRRWVFVVRIGLRGQRFVAAFPSEEEAEAQAWWEHQKASIPPPDIAGP